MRGRRILLGSCTAALLLLGCGEDGTGPEPCVPTESPTFDLKLEDLNGRAYDIKKAVCRSMVLVEFGATWCPSCRRSVPRLQEWHENYGDRGLKVIAVSGGEDLDVVRSFYEEQGTTFLVLLDPNGAVTYFWGVKSIPTFVLVSKEGEEVARQVGFGEEELDALEEEIVGRLDPEWRGPPEGD